MSKGKVEQQIANLNQLKASPLDSSVPPTLRKALVARVNLIAAKAAQVVGDLQLKALVPDLLAAFQRLLNDGDRTDPQCWGKNAIAKSLVALDYDESAPFLTGYRYVQMEASWGGKVDTAVTLRSICTLALIQCTDLSRIEKFRHLISALSDPRDAVRIDAIRAMEQMEGDHAALLLRLKAVGGDPRAAVVGQALESLLRLEGSEALDFAAGFLTERDTVARQPKATQEELIEEAALAIGASRVPAAIGVLRQAWTDQRKAVFLQAISASRLDSAFEFLLDMVRTAPDHHAGAALDALSLHRDSAEVVSAVRSAVEAREGSDLRARFGTKFDG